MTIIQKYRQNDTQVISNKKFIFNGVYSRKKLPNIENRAYVTNPDECRAVVTH